MLNSEFDIDSDNELLIFRNCPCTYCGVAFDNLTEFEHHVKSREHKQQLFEKCFEIDLKNFTKMNQFEYIYLERNTSNPDAYYDYIASLDGRLKSRIFNRIIAFNAGDVLKVPTFNSTVFGVKQNQHCFCCNHDYHNIINHNASGKHKRNMFKAYVKRVIDEDSGSDSD